MEHSRNIGTFHLIANFFRGTLEHSMEHSILTYLLTLFFRILFAYRNNQSV